MSHQLPQLTFAFNALEPVIDAKTMEIHHGKHHAAYVANLNNALAEYPALQAKPVRDLLADLTAVPEKVRTAVRNNGGGHFNHSLFWQWIAPGGAKQPAGTLEKEIVRTFGSYEQFVEDFNNACMTRFGSGWGWLVLNKERKLQVVSTANQDSPVMEGSVPLLGLDVWEHAYYLNYQNRRADYVKAFWNIVNWTTVQDLYASA